MSSTVSFTCHLRRQVKGHDDVILPEQFNLLRSVQGDVTSLQKPSVTSSAVISPQ